VGVAILGPSTFEPRCGFSGAAIAGEGPGADDEGDGWTGGGISTRGATVAAGSMGGDATTVDVDFTGEFRSTIITPAPTRTMAASAITPHSPRRLPPVPGAVWPHDAIVPAFGGALVTEEGGSARALADSPAACTVRDIRSADARARLGANSTSAIASSAMLP
jgi:hypothetical protein